MLISDALPRLSPAQAKRAPADSRFGLRVVCLYDRNAWRAVSLPMSTADARALRDTLRAEIGRPSDVVAMNEAVAARCGAYGRRA